MGNNNQSDIKNDIFISFIIRKIIRKMDYRITPTAEYGQHISLFCIHHPEKRWHTKNIDCIGARTIFASQEEWGIRDGKLANLYECSCPLNDLRVVADHPDIISRSDQN